MGNFDVADYKYGQKPNQTAAEAQIGMIFLFADEGSQCALQAWEAFTTFLKRSNRGLEGVGLGALPPPYRVGLSRTPYAVARPLG